jgi:pimeloyl-ACP methyl ester carboxylesterase
METEHRIRLVDGRTLACLELGKPGGAPVLYAHGYPGSRLEARLAAGSVKRLGLRLFALDRPGFGESTFLPHRTIGAWAADVAELADHFALERFALIGVSGGGPYALACAARLPERVRTLALVASMAPLDNSRQLTQDMATLNRLLLTLAARKPWLAQLIIGLVARLVRMNPARYLLLMKAMASATADKQVLDDADFRALLAASTAEALRQGGRGASWELTLLAKPWDFRLQEVRVPVHLWQGLADRIVPAAMARRLVAALPDCTPHYLPDEGHLSLIARYLDAVLDRLFADEVHH